MFPPGQPILEFRFFEPQPDGGVSFGFPFEPTAKTCTGLPDCPAGCDAVQDQAQHLQGPGSGSPIFPLGG